MRKVTKKGLRQRDISIEMPAVATLIEVVNVAANVAITEYDIHGTLAECKACTLVGKGSFSIAGLAAQVARSLDPTRTKCGQSCSGTRTRAC